MPLQFWSILLIEGAAILIHPKLLLSKGIPVADLGVQSNPPPPKNAQCFHEIPQKLPGGACLQTPLDSEFLTHPKFLMVNAFVVLKHLANIKGPSFDPPRIFLSNHCTLRISRAQQFFTHPTDLSLSLPLFQRDNHMNKNTRYILPKLRESNIEATAADRIYVLISLEVVVKITTRKQKASRCVDVGKNVCTKITIKCRHFTISTRVKTANKREWFEQKLDKGA